MKKKSYTRGKWKIEIHEDEFGKSYAICVGYKLVAVCFEERNATVVSAAAELLQVLCTIMPYVDVNKKGVQEAIDKANAAIKKALP